MPPNSCAVPGRNPGTSSNVISGMLNASQKRTNRAPLTDASMSSTPARCAGWLATMPDRSAAQPREADDEVAREVLVHLEKLSVVCDRMDQVEHVVGLVRRRRHEPIERRIFAIERVGSSARSGGGSRLLLGRNPSSSRISAQARAVVVDGEMRDAAALVVRHRAAELFLRHFLVRHGLDDVRPRHEHVARRRAP